MSCILSLFNTPDPDDTSNKMLIRRDVLIEFVSTTVFVYFGTLSVLATGSLLVGSGLEEDAAKLFPIAFAFGVGITVLVYSMGHLTGGHMNPGVSLMMYLLREISLKRMLFYWLAQFIGAILASSLLWGSLSEPTKDFNSGPLLNLGATTLNPALNSGNGFLLELMGSFFFYFVIAQTALDKRGVADSFFPPLAIGFSLVVVHVGLIPFTGCGVNPARTFGPSMVVCMDPDGDCGEVVQSSYWIYWIGPFTASFLVAEFHNYMGVRIAKAEEEEDAIKESKLASAKEDENVEVEMEPEEAKA